MGTTYWGICTMNKTYVAVLVSLLLVACADNRKPASSYYYKDKYYKSSYPKDYYGNSLNQQKNAYNADPRYNYPGTLYSPPSTEQRPGATSHEPLIYKGQESDSGTPIPSADWFF